MRPHEPLKGSQARTLRGEIAPGALRRSTLDRHLDKKSASRRMLHTLGDKRHVKLFFAHPLDFRTTNRLKRPKRAEI